jgi:hypothetical protein
MARINSGSLNAGDVGRKLPDLNFGGFLIPIKKAKILPLRRILLNVGWFAELVI